MYVYIYIYIYIYIQVLLLLSLFLLLFDLSADVQELISEATTWQEAPKRQTGVRQWFSTSAQGELCICPEALTRIFLILGMSRTGRQLCTMQHVHL